MSSPGPLLESKVAALRRQFDEEFAAPPRDRRDAFESLLAIVAGGEKLAIRLHEISAFAPLRSKVLAVPSSVPELLGITAVRGRIVPLFSLAGLLRLDGTRDRARWMITSGEAHNSIALAFEGFDGYLRVQADEVFQAADQAGNRHVGKTVRHDGMLRGIVHVTSLAEEIRNSGLSPEQ